MSISCRLRALGLVSALGVGQRDTWSQLLASSREHLTRRCDFVPDREVYVGEVAIGLLAEIPERYHSVASRNSRLSFAAVDQLHDELLQLKAAVGPDRIGVVVGTSTSGIGSGEIAHRARRLEGQFPQWYDFSQQEMGTTARAVAEYTEVSGPAFTVSTACSSSAKVFADARALLSAELCDAVLVGGVDSLCHLTVQGFSSLELVAPTFSNPMSKNRSGLNIGEGAALFVMTREPGGVQLLGVGESCDAYHMSAPEPSGRGAFEAMAQALAEARCRPDDINYINLHGTGTLHNDSAEGAAIKQLFGSLAVPCSSIKQLVGHTLGAAGAIEAAACFLALQNISGSEMRLPPHLWDGVKDESIPDLRLVEQGESFAVPEYVRFMSNSFAFGGNNCCLVVGRSRDGA